MLSAIRTKSSTMLGTVNGRVCELAVYSRKAANSVNPLRGLSAATIVGFLSFVAAEAQAALPAVIGTTLTEVETDGLALADLVWPILLGFLGVSLLMKLAKRFGNKM